jgi:hypothetical protein
VISDRNIDLSDVSILGSVFASLDGWGDEYVCMCIPTYVDNLNIVMIFPLLYTFLLQSHHE